MSTFTKVRTREQIIDVVNLARQIWTDHYLTIIGQEQVDYMLEKFQSEDAIATQIGDGYEYYIVWHNGRNSGYMAFFSDADAGMLMLSKIYVVRAERGQGLGRLMLEFAEHVCRERRIGTLWLNVNKNNTRSIAWYKRMGFKNVGSTMQDIGCGYVMDDYRMEKTVEQ